MSGGAWMPHIRVRPAPTSTNFSTRWPTSAPPTTCLPPPTSMPVMNSGFLPNSSADEFGRNPEFITGIEVGGGRQVVGGADVGHRVEKFVEVGAGLTLI